VSQRLIAEEQIEWMKNLLERLGAMDREVLCLCYLEGLPFREIAAVLGISENAAKVRHFRALECLRKLSDPDELAERRT
jgi:RNA polymerase sigma-70 factor (ECF subfamily)